MGARNRVLGTVAILSIAISTMWIFLERRRELSDPGLEGSLEHDWSVDINQATVRELQLIPGVGPKLAESILDRREQLGGFDSLDQLADIPGIKDQRVRTLSRYLKVPDSPVVKPSSLADE